MCICCYKIKKEKGTFILVNNLKPIEEINDLEEIERKKSIYEIEETLFKLGNELDKKSVTISSPIENSLYKINVDDMFNIVPISTSSQEFSDDEI